MREDDVPLRIKKVLSQHDPELCYRAAMEKDMPEHLVRALFRRTKELRSTTWIERFRSDFRAEVLGESIKERSLDRLLTHGDSLDRATAELAKELRREQADRQAVIPFPTSSPAKRRDGGQ